MAATLLNLSRLAAARRGGGRSWCDLVLSNAGSGCEREADRCRCNLQNHCHGGDSFSTKWRYSPMRRLRLRFPIVECGSVRNDTATEGVGKRARGAAAES